MLQLGGQECIKVLIGKYRRSAGSKWGPLDETIDPRSPDEEATTGPIEDLVDLPVDDKDPSKVLKLGKNLSDELREAISAFLKQNLDVFTWKYSDM